MNKILTSTRSSLRLTTQTKTTFAVQIQFDSPGPRTGPIRTDGPAIHAPWGHMSEFYSSNFSYHDKYNESSH